jgi:hypothetical protein
VAEEIELLRRFIEEIPGPSTDAWARARAAVAAARAEEAPARRRPGRWPARRRIVPVTATLAAAAAAVTGVLVALFPAAPAGPGGGGQVRETAYLVNRVQDALSRSGQHSLVGYSRTVFPAGTVTEPAGIGGWHTTGPAPGAPSPHTASVLVTWQYRDSAADVASTATGQPVYAEHTTGTAHRLTATGVSYRTATWWHATQTLTPGTQQPAAGCSPPGYLPSQAAGWPGYIRRELSCGAYHPDGRQRVDGIDAVKLTTENTAGRWVLWINPATYLPLRQTSLQLIGPGKGQSAQTDFRWLPVTAASLAHLTVRVPAGFRHVPPPPG